MLLRRGYANPMRGKSLTCRKLNYQFLKVSDLFYSRSQTCHRWKMFRQVRDLPRIRAAKPRNSTTDRVLLGFRA
jgi:hypothetical protein